MVNKLLALVLLLSFSVAADAQVTSVQSQAPAPFEFPEAEATPEDDTPSTESPAPESEPEEGIGGGLLSKGITNWTSEDWQKFIDFIVPIIMLLVGAFGGNLALRAKKAFSETRSRGERRVDGLLDKLLSVERQLQAVHERVGGEDIERRRAARKQAITQIRDALDNAEGFDE